MIRPAIIKINGPRLNLLPAKRLRGYMILL